MFVSAEEFDTGGSLDEETIGGIGQLLEGVILNGFQLLVKSDVRQPSINEPLDVIADNVQGMDIN